jgi:hypothetical protein
MQREDRRLRAGREVVRRDDALPQLVRGDGRSRRPR